MRNAEWFVCEVKAAEDGGQVLYVRGLTAPVLAKKAAFWTSAEGPIDVLLPENVDLQPDHSTHARDTRLKIESMLRNRPVVEEAIAVGHRAAMDPLPFQLVPAQTVLRGDRDPRARILIADAVGLGKTLEAGILLSELIARGKASRILVVTLKSMMAQFQKEMWSRFTLPLIRLDSAGLQRIRANIPTHHNPFNYYDKTIISIDTLKQDNQFKAYLENARWDVIVVDEAHNVAARGKCSVAQRAALAKLLAPRCEHMILLSATPHDGSRESFASLMNMLDPLALPDPSNYTKDDIKGLYVRRFKQDVKDEIREHFPERKLIPLPSQASLSETALHAALRNLSLVMDARRRNGDAMFKTTLVKALLSSPAAFISTVENRVANLERNTPDSPDIAKLKVLLPLASEIDAAAFSKYQLLLSTLNSKAFNWSPRKGAMDRLVIFTESLKTKAWLLERLKSDLGLNDKQVVGLDGGMKDRDIMLTVESFGKSASKIRILVASDVASEGINLHYCSHRMFHFDMPWSLIVFQQRNGRIDRYGQSQTPEIYTMVTSVDGKGDDSNVLNHLIERERNAYANIGDPGQILELFDPDKERSVVEQTLEDLWAGADRTADVATVLEKHLIRRREGAPAPLAATPDDLDDLLFSNFGKDESTGSGAAEHFPPPRQRPTLFPVEAEFLKTGFRYLADNEIAVEQPVWNSIEELLELPTSRELNDWCGRVLPYEIRIKGQDLPRFRLTACPERMQRAVVESRAVGPADDEDEEAEPRESWPDLSFLWPLHPISGWLTAYVESLAGTHAAPVLTTAALPAGASCFLVVAQVPNPFGEPLLQAWYGVPFAADGAPLPLCTLESLIADIGLADPDLANPGTVADATVDTLRGLRKQAVERAVEAMVGLRHDFAVKEAARNAARERALSARLGEASRQMELRLGDIRDLGIRRMKAVRLEQERRDREKELADFVHWAKTNRHPEEFVHAVIVAVFVNAPVEAREVRHA
jgi:superfamily II DNA or RNA helicase